MLRRYGKDLLLLVIGLSLGIGIGLIVLIGLAEGKLNWNIDLGGVRIGPEIGAMAPDFTLGSLQEGDIQLSNFQGQPVILNFWATWCGPCRLEMPIIEEYHEQFAPDLVVLAVNLQESKPEVQFFANELDLRFLILLDLEAQVSAQYRVQGLPTTFFIDRAGKIQAIHIGSLTEKHLESYLIEIGIDL